MRVLKKQLFVYSAGLVSLIQTGAAWAFSFGSYGGTTGLSQYNQYNPSTASSGAGSASAVGVATNITNSAQMIGTAIMVVASVIGLGFGVAGLVKLSRSSKTGDSPAAGFKYIGIGAGLFTLGVILKVFSNTFFGGLQ
ncbi:MAG: hypothetical protein ACYDDA_15405 [Acidiferrobacteraceae bacterium]